MIGLIISVSSHVKREVIGTSELLTADFTFKPFLSSVYPHVSSDAVDLSEFLVADGTRERVVSD